MLSSGGNTEDVPGSTIRFQFCARCPRFEEKLQAGDLGAILLKPNFSMMLERYLEYPNGIPVICALNAGCVQWGLCMDCRESGPENWCGCSQADCSLMHLRHFCAHVPGIQSATRQETAWCHPWCHPSWAFRE